MLDCYNRTIDYLRISLTDRCNLRCIYCMPAEGVRWVPHTAILSYEQLLRLCRIFASLGLKKIKLTGGEPLVRPGVDSLIAALKDIPGIENVTLTTNGVLLSQQLPGLVEAGLDGVNISLDAVEEDIFAAITRRPGVDQVLGALRDALAVPHLNVKINCVPMGLNTSQLVPLAELARDSRLAVRYIELMPIGLGKSLAHPDEGEVRALLEQAFGPLTPYEGKLGNGPCSYYSLPGFQGKIGFISAMTHQFCAGCNRVRLTSGGFLKTCLQYEKGVDLMALLEQGADDEVLRAAMEQAILEKPAHHQFSDSAAQTGLEQHIMSQIGG